MPSSTEIQQIHMPAYPWIGPAWIKDDNTYREGRWFSDIEPPQSVPWTLENYRAKRAWISAFKDIFCTYPNLSLEENIAACWNDGPQQKTVRGNLRRFFAARHGIQVTDSENSFDIDPSLILPHVESRPQISMSSDRLDEKMQQAIQGVQHIYPYLLNSQVGIFAGISTMLPDPVNESVTIDDPVKQLVIAASSLFDKKAQNSSRIILSLAETQFEADLHRERVKVAAEQIRTTLYENLFPTSRRGPVETMEFITKHDRVDFGVVGVHEFTDPSETYTPDPWTIYHTVDLRKWQSADGIWRSVHIREEKKSGPSEVLKIGPRKDSHDPRVNKDVLRIDLIFPDRRGMDAFVYDVKAASKKAGWELKLFDDQDSLDGKGFSGDHGGSSSLFSVLRYKAVFNNLPDVPIEISFYPPEGTVDNIFRDGAAIGEYLRMRLQSRRNRPQSVLDVLFPADIHEDLQFDELIRAQIEALRVTARSLPFVPNKRQKERPFLLTDSMITEATVELRDRLLEMDFSPNIIIAVGSNIHSSANELGKQFGATVIGIDPGRKDYTSIINKLSQWNGMNILILDDIGDKAAHSGDIYSVIEDYYKKHEARSSDQVPHAQIAFLVQKEGSLAASKGYISGITIPRDTHAFFPDERLELPPAHAISVGLIARKRNGRIELLVQHEKDGIVKLPGGKFDRQKDKNVHDTFQRELREEIPSEDLRKAIFNRKVRRFAIEVKYPKESRVPAHTLNMFGYVINGDGIDDTLVRDQVFSAESEIDCMEWMTIDKFKTHAQENHYEAYLSLMEEFEQWIVGNEQWLKDEKQGGVLYQKG